MPQHYNAMPENFLDFSTNQAFNPMKDLNLGIDPLKSATEDGGLFANLDLWGGTDAQGNKTQSLVGGGIDALTGLGNLYMGYQQHGLAEKELAFQQQQARINNTNQMQSLNTLMAGQADNRRIASGGQSMTGADFVKQHGMINK